MNVHVHNSPKIKASQLHLILFGFFLGFSVLDSRAQLFTQQFNTAFPLTSGVNTTSGVYCNPAPANTQFTMLGSSGSGASYEVPAATERLTFSRMSDACSFVRALDFNPIPTSMVWSFDLEVKGNNSPQNNAGVFFTGFDLQNNNNVEIDWNIHSRIGINLGGTPGQFSLRDGNNGTSSASFTGTQRIFLVINNTGAPITYMAPNGTPQTLGNDLNDVWVGTTQVFDEIPCVTGDRFLRRIKFVFNNGVGTIEMDNMNVAPVPSAPSASNQTICGVAGPTIGNLVAAGTELKWYENASGGSPLAASHLLVNGSTYFVSQTVAGVESHRTPVTVTLSDVVVNNNVIATDQTICNGQTPQELTGQSVSTSGGSGNFTYQWQISSAGPITGFSNIGGATGQNYQPLAQTANRWFRRMVLEDGCQHSSNVVLITVNQPISNTISSAQTVCEGANPATLTGNPSGGNGVYTYVWESSTTSAIDGFSVISGAESQTLAPGPLTQTTWFRRIVSAGVCPSSTSAAIQLTVIPAVANNTITDNQTLCNGTIPNNLIGSLPTGGTGTYTYAWELSTTSAVSGFSSLSGHVGQDLIFSVAATTGQRWYRRRITSGVCINQYSNVIQMIIQAPIGNNTVSAAQTICAGSTPAALTGTVPNGGNGTYTYQWQASTISSTTGFSDIVNATDPTFAPGVLNQTTWYRRVVISPPCANNISTAIAVTVNQPILTNTISANQSICSGTAPSTLTGSVATGGNGTSYAYLWEFATSALGPFSTTGITSLNYSPPSLTANRWYRRRVTSGVCPVSYSDTVMVTVFPVISTNTITAAQTICSGTVPSTLNGSNPVGSSGSYTYIWQSSTTSSTAGFSDIPASNSQNFSPTALTQTTWFRRVVVSSPCANNTSTAIAITVTQPILNNTLTFTPIPICSGTSPGTITANTPTGGNGTFAYLWEVATAIEGPFASTGSTGATYNPGNLTATRWYRRRVTSGACPVSYSDTVQISVTPTIGTNTVSASQTICAGSTPAGFTGSLPTGGNGSYTYQWQLSTTSSTTGFTSISGAENQNFASGSLNQTTWFRRMVTSGPCQSTSAALTVTVNQPITNNQVSFNQIICSGTAPATLTGTVVTGGNGSSYSYLWEFATSATGTFSSTSVTSLNYSPPVITANRWYRRRVTSGVCPASFSDTIAVSVVAPIVGNTLNSPHAVCIGSPANELTGNSLSGGNGAYTYVWESSTTSASSGFSTIPAALSETYSPGLLSQTTWFRRIVTAGVCTNISPALQVTVDFVPSVSAGPAVGPIVQGGFTGPLGGTFSGASAAIWSAPDGTFQNNDGSNPAATIYQASINSPSPITLTLSVNGGACGTISDSKELVVIPDPFGITGVINQYGEVVGPNSFPAGTLVCTLATGEGSRFAAGDRVLLIQMKGASVSLPTNPNDETYGYITAMNNSGNHEFLELEDVSGDVVTFKRCTRKAYHIWGRIQLVKVPRYVGDYNVKPSTSISAIRLTRKGFGYPPNTTITTGFTITPVSGGSGLAIQAKTDDLGQIAEVEILNPGAGYYQPPIITMPDPTVAPFDLPAYKAKALAVTGLTAKQWNGKTGGILAFEVDGNLTLLDSIHMAGMGFAGGNIGDKGGLMPTCGATAEYALNFATVSRAGQKGEGIANTPVTAMRGKGRYATGGGGGVEPEGGGGGGANWQDGGKGGGSSYVVFPLSACGPTVTPCDKDASRGGLAGGTNPSTPVGFKNVLRSNSYYYQPALCRIFLGGGGGGGHAFNETTGMQTGGAGGFGGGIVIIKANSLRSNNYEIKANGEKGENAVHDGAGGGGAGGAILLLVDQFHDLVRGRVNGGDGGNAISLICDDPGDGSYPARRRYFGAGGGGGGGVVWFTQPDPDVVALALGCNLASSNQGKNDDGFGNTATKGGSSRSQSELVAIENLPYLGSTFTVGGTSPKPDFVDLAAAATWLAFRGTDAENITLLVTENTSSPSLRYRYSNPATFSRIFTPGCTYGDATLTIRPRTTPNSVNLVNQIDDLNYIILDDIPQVTFQDIQISGDYDFIDTRVVAKNNSKMVLNRVTGNSAIFASESSGDNEITASRVVNGGGFNIGANQTLNITDSLKLIGHAVYSRNLTLGSGSTLNLPAGTRLNMEGVNWINNGAANLNISPLAQLNFQGAFTNQIIGGTASTHFNVLNVKNTGQLNVFVNTTVDRWLQTGPANINTSTRTLTITEFVTSASGQFTGTGGGRVALSHPTQPVEVRGTFFNLEVNSPGHSNAIGNITVNGTLVLTNGKLNTNGNLVTIENATSSGTSNSSTSWVNGPLRRRVAAGNSFFFPVGDANKLERAFVNINSLSGGMQYLTAQFTPQDPTIHPTASIVNPLQDGPAYFSSVDPSGYWSINPNAGSASYDIWLYPSFLGMFPQYSIYKRATGGNEWNILGTLENPENTTNYVQADGSVRRNGLTGFSDFALAGGEEPLPLHFLSFQVGYRNKAARLTWKMAECLTNGRFILYKGTFADQLERFAEVTVHEDGNCTSEFQANDEALLTHSPRIFYRIEATARNEKAVLSPVRMINLAQGQAEKPFLAIVQNENRKFQIMNEGIEESGIRVLTLDGKVIASNINVVDRIIDLSMVPNGVYLVEMVNSGWTVRQKIVVGF